MFSKTILGSVVAASGLAVASLEATPTSSQATTSLITPAPQLELRKRQNDDRYIGWVSWNGSWGSEECDIGGTLYRTDNFWRCCHTSDSGCARTDIPVGCVSGSLIYPAEASSGSSLSNTLETWPCTSVFTDAEDASFTICNTIFLYNNDRDSSPLTNVNCGVSSLNWSYYREPPATAITGSVPPSSASAGSTGTGAASSTASPDPSIVTSPQDAPGKNGETEKKESKAWIAGAVVGPIVGLALIGLGAFFFWRHKKNKKLAPAAGQASYAPAPTGAPGSPPQYTQDMQQGPGAPGMVPYGVSKHESWAPPQQQWDPNQAPQNGYYPSPTASPAPGHIQPVPYSDNNIQKHTADNMQYTNELPADNTHSTAPPKPQ